LLTCISKIRVGIPNLRRFCICSSQTPNPRPFLPFCWQRITALQPAAQSTTGKSRAGPRDYYGMGFRSANIMSAFPNEPTFPRIRSASVSLTTINKSRRLLQLLTSNPSVSLPNIIPPASEAAVDINDVRDDNESDVGSNHTGYSVDPTVGGGYPSSLVGIYLRCMWRYWVMGLGRMPVTLARHFGALWGLYFGVSLV